MQATSRGFTINYLVAGAGPPLVLVPGTMSAARDWKLYGYVDALAEQFRVVAVDPLGHGRSDKPHDPEAYLAADVTADLLAVLDAEGIERAVVWGYSRGGWIAYLLATSWPERVERAIIGGFAATAHEAEAPRQRAWVEQLSGGDWASFWRSLGVEDHTPLKPIEDANDAIAVAAAVAGAQRPTRYVDLDAVRCPTLHYVGGEDPIAEFVLADVERLGARHEVLVGANHLVAFGDAGRALAVVRPWLAETVGNEAGP